MGATPRPVTTLSPRPHQKAQNEPTSPSSGTRKPLKEHVFQGLREFDRRLKISWRVTAVRVRSPPPALTFRAWPRMPRTCEGASVAGSGRGAPSRIREGGVRTLSTRWALAVPMSTRSRLGTRIALCVVHRGEWSMPSRWACRPIGNGERTQGLESGEGSRAPRIPSQRAACAYRGRMKGVKQSWSRRGWNGRGC